MDRLCGARTKPCRVHQMRGLRDISPGFFLAKYSHHIHNLEWFCLCRFETVSSVVCFFCHSPLLLNTTPTIGIFRTNININSMHINEWHKTYRIYTRSGFHSENYFMLCAESVYAIIIVSDT